MKVNVKTKKMQEVETIEVKEIDLERLIKVLKTRIEVANESDMICVSKESLEDAIIVLEQCFDKDKEINSFKKKIPVEIDNEIKSIAMFLHMMDIKP